MSGPRLTCCKNIPTLEGDSCVLFFFPLEATHGLAILLSCCKHSSDRLPNCLVAPPSNRSLTPPPPPSALLSIYTLPCLVQVARQERERKRLLEAEAKAEEDADGDAAGVPGNQSESSSKHTATPLMEGGQDAPKTPQDEENEVRQCLEHILSVCVAAADADGENGHETGVDSGAVAEIQATSKSEVGLGDREEHAKEEKEASFSCETTHFGTSILLSTLCTPLRQSSGRMTLWCPSGGDFFTLLRAKLVEFYLVKKW